MALMFGVRLSRIKVSFLVLLEGIVWSFLILMGFYRFGKVCMTLLFW
jgi:hypothetical protein